MLIVGKVGVTRNYGRAWGGFGGRSGRLTSYWGDQESRMLCNLRTSMRDGIKFIVLVTREGEGGNFSSV